MVHGQNSRADASPLGALSIEPDTPVEAGRVGTWTLKFVVGEAGMATGGGLRVMPPVTVPEMHYVLVRWQLNTVSVSGPDGSEVTVDLVHLNRGRYDGAQACVVEVRNVGRVLKEAEIIDVLLKHAVASRFAMREARFEVEVDPSGERRYSCVEKELSRTEREEIVSRFRLPDPPVIDVVSGPAVRFERRRCPVRGRTARHGALCPCATPS